MSTKEFECTSSDGGHGRLLSNLHPYQFDIDGFRCASMEGFLQSLKTDLPGPGAQLRSMSGVACFKAGQAFTKQWQATQTLYWQYQPYHRQSKGYHELIKRAYDALATNEDFARNLLYTCDNNLVHSIGRNDSTLTVLTQSEFLYNLYRVRSNLLSAN